jgi:hypothetical protein
MGIQDRPPFKNRCKKEKGTKEHMDIRKNYPEEKRRKRNDTTLP